MLHIDVPTMDEIRALNVARDAASVTMYLETTPLTQKSDEARITLSNLLRDALAQLEANGADRRTLEGIRTQVEDLEEDPDFWRYQAHAKALFVTPNAIRTWRLPNRISSSLHVSDRFHLKPLLRSVTFPHEALVLCLSENAVRLVEVTPDLAPRDVTVPGLPSDAASAVGRPSVNDRSPRGRLQGSEGQKVLLLQYVRRVQESLRPLLAGSRIPLVLAATEPLNSLYRTTNSYPGLTPQGIQTSPDRVPNHEIAAQARTILDQVHDASVAAVREMWAARVDQRRATSELSTIARAATFGAVDTLLVDMNDDAQGTIDEETGALTLASTASASSYGIVDEIAGRALASGARVLAVRSSDMPDGQPIAAILRYAF
jgi:hypothetical protein